MVNARRVVAVLDEADPGAGANPELLTAARQLADALGGQVTALALAPAERDAAGEAIAFGADEVVIARAPWLAGSQPDALAAALAEACGMLAPHILLLPHDAMGREVAPRLAARLGAGLVTDCIALDADNATGALAGVRPCFSGKALSEWLVDGPGPRIATLRRQSIVPAGANVARDGQISTLQLAAGAPIRTRVLERIVPTAGQVRLEDAEVVISVGRGVGSREAFQEYFANGLAKVLNAPCGGSRGAVDLGIVPPELQVGLTGRVVSPKLYIAVGLSGSPQHMAGCSGARTIVAVNTDPQAPIFGFAHYGVVGDYRNVIPSLTEALRHMFAVT